jgi:hypothetical protein
VFHGYSSFNNLYLYNLFMYSFVFVPIFCLLVYSSIYLCNQFAYYFCVLGYFIMNVVVFVNLNVAVENFWNVA